MKRELYVDGPYKNPLIELIRKQDLIHCFTFRVSSPNLKSLYSNYDYMLQPTHMECFSLSILESLAANVPVITTSVGGNKEVVVSGTNGFLVEAKDIMALKEVLEALCRGHKQIQSNTRTFIEERFSLTTMVKNHMALVLE